MKSKTLKKRTLYFIIAAVILLIVLRIAWSWSYSDGFSGLSLLIPLLLLFFILFAICAAVLFSSWVYQDCKQRGDDPVLWAIIVFITTPLIGLLIYFLRRSEIKHPCPCCGHLISSNAKYCEACGSQMNYKEETISMEKQKTHHMKRIIAGTVCLILMLICLSGFIVSAATRTGINTDITSNERVWNLGTIHMNSNTYINGIWKLDFRNASDGFVSQEKMTITNPASQTLYADISCQTVPDGTTLLLWLVQGDTVQTIDVTRLPEPLAYPLNNFESGEIYVRLQINGVEDTVSEIYIR